MGAIATGRIDRWDLDGSADICRGPNWTKEQIARRSAGIYEGYAAMLTRRNLSGKHGCRFGLELDFQGELYAPGPILLRRHDAEDGT